MASSKQRLLALPFLTLLGCMLTSCRPPPLMSYPWFWDYTRARPKEADLSGRYKILKVRLSGELAKSLQERDPSVTVNVDNTAVLANFPSFDGFGDRIDCNRTGTADWSLDKDLGASSGWQLAFENYRPSTASAACGQENAIWPVLLLRQKPPYRLYLTVGDPDSDTGIEFQKTAR